MPNTTTGNNCTVGDGSFSNVLRFTKQTLPCWKLYLFCDITQTEGGTNNAFCIVQHGQCWTWTYVVHIQRDQLHLGPSVTVVR